MARIDAKWVVQVGMDKHHLTKTEALVLIALLSWIDKKSGIAWRAQTDLARDLRISRQQINLAQSTLRDRGLLIEHEPGKQGRPTRYRFPDAGGLQLVA